MENGYEVWSQIKKEQKISPDHVGKRVWVAGDFKSSKVFLKEYHKAGERGWKDGGVVVKTDGFDRSYYLQKVRLHPDEFKRKRKVNG